MLPYDHAVMLLSCCHATLPAVVRMALFEYRFTPPGIQLWLAHHNMTSAGKLAHVIVLPVLVTVIVFLLVAASLSSHQCFRQSSCRHSKCQECGLLPGQAELGQWNWERGGADDW